MLDFWDWENCVLISDLVSLFSWELDRVVSVLFFEVLVVLCIVVVV